MEDCKDILKNIDLVLLAKQQEVLEEIINDSEANDDDPKKVEALQGILTLLARLGDRLAGYTS